MNYLFICKTTFCLLFFACFVFWVGKKIGERKYLQIKEEMKALELSFNQLLNDVELMVSQNLNVMDSKIAETRELLPILDNKLLQSYDIITRLDEEKPKIKSTDSSAIEAKVEIVNFGKKCSAVKSSFENRFNVLEQKIHSLESIISRVEASLSNINQKGIMQIPTQAESSFQNEESPLIKSLDDISSVKKDCLAPKENFDTLPQKINEKTYTVLPEKLSELQPGLFSSKPTKPKTPSKPVIKTELFSVQSKNGLKPEMRTELLQMYSTRLKNVQNLEINAGNDMKSVLMPEIKPERESIKESIKELERESENKKEIRSLKTDIKLSDIHNKKSVREIDDLPPQGTPFYDVISLIRQGTTIPQVAKQLKLTIGEVELIRNLFPKTKFSLSQSAR